VQQRLQNTQGPSTVLKLVPSNLCFTDTREITSETYGLTLSLFYRRLICSSVSS